MKRIYFVLWACLFAGVLFAQSTKELYLFHTNDMHSRVEPFPEDFQDTMLLIRLDFYAVQLLSSSNAKYMRICCCSIQEIFRRVLLIIICLKGKWK